MFLRRILSILVEIVFGLLICAFVVLAVFVINDPLLRRDFAKAPVAVAGWLGRTATGLVRSARLALRPDVIEPKRFHFDPNTAEFDLILYRYVQTYPWITNGASLTFRFPRQYVLTNIVSGSGAVPEVPIRFNSDAQRPPMCAPSCFNYILATVSLTGTNVPALPSHEDFLKAPPLPDGGLIREHKGNMLFVPDAMRRRPTPFRGTLFAVGEEDCGFALYETDNPRGDDKSYLFDRARYFRREAANGRPARNVVCNVGPGLLGICRTIDPYELGMKIDVAFPRAMLCEADEVMQRARRIFDDHLIKRTDAVPGWGRRVED